MKKDIDIREFLDMTIEDIFADRFARYSKYIIQDRALPDVRDGLKPVQRRVVYSMNKEGNTFDKTFRKSAKTVGNVIGNYHPHGDTSVYDAMVRMSQTWKVNEQLVLMHGNNGSIDGDSAAAMRYTEAKMSKYAELMIENINEDTVNMIPNFDDTELEPTVLPTKVPNLLINGASGISAGYATDIPPHNAGEIVKAAIYLNNNSDATTKDLMKIVKGPDFPTGPTVQGLEGIKQAYETGRGKIVMRANYEIVKNVIVIKSLPYDVNKSTLLQRIDLIRIDKKIDGIQEIVDQSDQSGLEIHINCKRDANIDVILKYLLKNTDLQKNYNFNMIAIDNRKPKQLGLVSILSAFISHRRDVITRRSQYRLEKANQRLHILEGLIKAVDILDDIILIIKNSENKSNSKDNIITKYGFSDAQAEAIVMMQLYRLSNTDLKNLIDTSNELKANVEMLESILANDEVLKACIDEELKEVYQQVKSPRLTTIVDEIEEIVINQADLIRSEKMIVNVSVNGYVKRSSPRSYVASSSLAVSTEDDISNSSIACDTKDSCLIFFDDGTYVIIPVIDIPETKWRDQGRHISSIAKVNDGVRVVNMVCTSKFKEYRELVTVSKFGYSTRISFSSLKLNKLKQKIVWQKLKKDDKIVGIDFSTSSELDQLFGESVVFITNLGRYMKLTSSDVEEYQIQRMGKRISTLRKNEEFVCVMFTDVDFIMLTDLGGYVRFGEDSIPMQEKLIELYANIKSKPHQAIKFYKVNHPELLIVTSDDEEIIKVNSLKKHIVGERIKTLSKDKIVINIENIVSITD
jgi:topoisomerase-4 subunit A